METCQRKMGLDRLEVDRVMGMVREREKVWREHKKVKGPRVEAKKADVSRRRNIFHLETVRRLNSLAVMPASRWKRIYKEEYNE